jgi:hypothetical protein
MGRDQKNINTRNLAKKLRSDDNEKMKKINIRNHNNKMFISKMSFSHNPNIVPSM